MAGPRLLLCALLVLLASCARAPLKGMEGAFRPATELPATAADSFPLDGLRLAWQRNLAVFGSSPVIPQELRFGERVIARDDYRRALEALGPELESLERFNAFLRENFELHEVYGDEGWSQIFSTAYYDVSLRGSRKPTAEHTEPLYALPPDLVTVDLRAYAERLPDLKPLQDLVLEQKSRTPSWRGRLVPGEPAKVVPYYQRSEIQGAPRPLGGRGLELAWVNPIDAFYLEIQGSGEVVFADGKKLRLGYAGQNGSPYTPIGRFLWDVIPREQMSMQRIRRHLEGLGREQQQELFDKNASYVFFKQQDKLGALGYSGAEVTAHRSIAMDQFLFPQGVLGFLEIEHPVFAAEEDLDPSSWEARPRWVFNQDTGGAIKGGGRVDLFMGAGPEAERAAGVMKRKGRLWMAAPKEEFLQRLRASAAPVARRR